MKLLFALLLACTPLFALAQSRWKITYKATNVVVREGLEQMMRVNGSGATALLDGVRAPEFRDMGLTDC